jgi:hypothetical protein
MCPMGTNNGRRSQNNWGWKKQLTERRKQAMRNVAGTRLRNMQKQAHNRVYWQVNGPVGQVETPPEILLVYRARLVMIAHKILAAHTRHKGVKKLPTVGPYSWNSRHRARAWRSYA